MGSCPASDRAQAGKQCKMSFVSCQSHPWQAIHKGHFTRQRGSTRALNVPDNLEP